MLWSKGLRLGFKEVGLGFKGLGLGFEKLGLGSKGRNALSNPGETAQIPVHNNQRESDLLAAILVREDEMDLTRGNLSFFHLLSKDFGPKMLEYYW